MLVVNSRPEADGANTVDKLLAKTSLRNAKFGRFRISQGVQIDPSRPGEATVFAVIMDETELRDVQANLKTAFQDSVVEAEARPEIVTQLADLNDVSLGSGIAVAGLRVPEGVDSRDPHDGFGDGCEEVRHRPRRAGLSSER